jgi:hypothetical protein
LDSLTSLDSLGFLDSLDSVGSLVSVVFFNCFTSLTPLEFYRFLSSEFLKSSELTEFGQVSLTEIQNLSLFSISQKNSWIIRVLIWILIWFF